jgi:hypothetical protein
VIAVSTADGEREMKGISEETANATPAASPEGPEPAKKPRLGAQSANVGPRKGKSRKKASPAKRANKRAKAGKRAHQPAGGRVGTRAAQVLELLKRSGGATVQQIMAKTGWQKHTVRGFIAGSMKKAGHAVVSFKSEAGERTYRIGK